MNRTIKKAVCAVGIAALMFVTSGRAALGALAASSSKDLSVPPEITAKTAILMDAQTLQIYYQKDMHTQMYPASLTKIMTGILAVEYGSNIDTVTVPDDVTKSQGKSVANIALLPGEQVTMDELLYTMFLASANDSAQVVAERVGGTVDNFAVMMNTRAKKLGATDTNFTNPNGLPDKNNVTSAYDLALITKKAVDMPGVMKYFGALTYKLPATNKRNDAQTFTNLHKMMKKTVYYNKEVIAGKTGWETMSGNTLVTVANRNGRTLICVLLKCDSSYTMYTETKSLLEYGFACTADPTAEKAVYTENLSTDLSENSQAEQATVAVPSASVQKQPRIQKSLLFNAAKVVLYIVIGFGALIGIYAVLIRIPGRRTKKLRRVAHDLKEL